MLKPNSYAPPALAYQKRYDYDVDGNVVYEGWAAPGQETSAAAWAICKRVYSAGRLVAEYWTANANETAIWDNRAALTYA